MKILETGDIYFLYRPRVEERSPESLEEIQRLFIVLNPEPGTRFRLLVVGRKQLPEIEDGGDKYWGFVDRVASKPEDLHETLRGETHATRTRGERFQPPARACGEGVYALVDHDGHTHLAYALELPQRPGDVQHALHIEPEASYVLSVKNPEASSPPGVGLRPRQKADLPRSLQTRFGRRRFLGVDTPVYLDHAGVEFVLIGARENAEEELGIEFRTEPESADSAELFADLRLRKSEKRLTPLVRGEWR